MPTRCVWIDGVPETIKEKQLYDQFSRFGPVMQTIIDQEKGHALIFYETVSYHKILFVTYYSNLIMKLLLCNG